MTRRPTPRPKYWAARLDAIDPLPDGGPTAAEAYKILAFRSWEAAARQPVPGAWQPAETVARGPWDQERDDVAVVTEVFESRAYEQASAELREAVKAGWRERYGLAPRARLPDSYDYESWAEWLMAHSRWAREHNGDIDVAVEDWLTVLRLSRQFRRGGLGYDWFWAARWVSSVAAEMVYCVSESAGAIDTHELMLQIDSIEAPGATPGALLEEARLSMQCYLEFVYVREGAGWLSVSDSVSTSGASGGAPKPSRIWNLASPLFHDLGSARAAVDRYIGAAEALSDIRACVRRHADREGDRSDLDLTVLDGFPGCGSWLLERALWRHYMVRCELDAGVTMLALREYHRAYGSYPVSLEELVPDFLPRLPIDYVDRRALRYARTDDGYLLYSIGEDGRDDGGAHDLESRDRWDRDYSPDVVFSAVRRPEGRRR